MMRGGVARATVGQWVSRGAGLGLQAAHFAVLARALGRDELAAWSAAYALLAIAGAIAEFGLTDTIVLRLERDRERADAIVVAARRAAVALAVAALAVAFAGSFVLPSAARLPLVTLVPWFVLSRLNAVPTAYRRWSLEFTRVAAAECLGRAVQVAAVSILLLTDLDRWARFAVASGSLGVGSAVALTILARGLPLRSSGPGLPVWALVRAAIPLGLTTTASFVHARVDQIVMSALSDPDSLASYAVAARVPEVSLALVVAGAAVGFAHVVRSSGLDLVLAARRHQTIVSGAAITVGVGIAAAASPVVTILGGARYSSADELVLLLVPGIVAGMLNVAGAQLMVASGRAMQLLVVAVALAVVHVAVLVPAVVAFDAKGAAAATSVTEVVGMVVIGWLAARAVPGARCWTATVVPWAGALVAGLGGAAAWEAAGAPAAALVVAVGLAVACAPLLGTVRRKGPAGPGLVPMPAEVRA
jgi:O-antigen/teichoic acid export membrane protein